ncbi:hypothetical protein RRG08_056330 [Elysia crispata]|uniref:Uncharacterized protein n=1 Tax=Elysia crispata TaxID=231223 RepID=A0AAE1D2X0_9GAST|nr:hypothetical protein RRG08_056330 [Elysia crispata]
MRDKSYHVLCRLRALCYQHDLCLTVHRAELADTGHRTRHGLGNIFTETVASVPNSPFYSPPLEDKDLI